MLANPPGRVCLQCAYGDQCLYADACQRKRGPALTNVLACVVVELHALLHVRMCAEPDANVFMGLACTPA